jgi:hypothetical protein
VHVVIALVDCKSTKIEHETGDRIPTLRIKRVEAIVGDDLKRAPAARARLRDAARRHHAAVRARGGHPRRVR